MGEVKDKIIVIGSEEFTLGFELVGIESISKNTIESCLSSSSSIGIIILSQEVYDELSLRIQKRIEELLKPIVIVLSESEVQTNSLREMIIKSLGVDLLKEKNSQ